MVSGSGLDLKPCLGKPHLSGAQFSFVVLEHMKNMTLCTERMAGPFLPSEAQVRPALWLGTGAHRWWEERELVSILWLEYNFCDKLALGWGVGGVGAGKNIQPGLSIICLFPTSAPGFPESQDCTGQQIFSIHRFGFSIRETPAG